MIRTSGVWALVVISLVTMEGATRAQQPPPGRISDPAQFFSQDALARARRLVAQIRERNGRDVIVQTFEQIPQAKQAAFKSESKEQFFDEWIVELANQRQLNGVFILVVKNPGRLQIGLGNQTREKEFTAHDRDEARDLMLSHFRQKRYDQGLVEGLQFVWERMWENQHPGSKFPAADFPASMPAFPLPPGPATNPATQPATTRSSTTRPAVSQEKPPSNDNNGK